MIILDTNVVSALMQPVPDARVSAWLDRQPVESTWITSVTAFEIEVGLELLPDGRRHRALKGAFNLLLSDDLERRVLPFDEAAASEAARLAAGRQKSGRTMDLRDTLIAGIALARRASLATRNVRHFSDLPVEVVNPWE